MSNTQDDQAGAALQRSTAYVLADRVRAMFVSAVSNSRITSIWRRVAQPWASSSWAERRRAGGTLVLVASIWHVMLLLMFGEYASRLVFALPAIAAFIGALAIVSASPRLARR
jgi:hypothetical protein